MVCIRITIRIREMFKNNKPDTESGFGLDVLIITIAYCLKAFQPCAVMAISFWSRVMSAQPSSGFVM